LWIVACSVRLLLHEPAGGYAASLFDTRGLTMRQVSRTALVGLLLALTACAGGPDTRKQEEILLVYSSAIRWGHIDEALAFIDPKVLAEKPLSAVDRARFEQVQIAGYQVKNSVAVGEDELQQLVEIRVVNRHTQVERVITDRQRWRWDEEAKTWWLTSGLPNLGGN
jgi:hypothetical protein